MTKLRKKWAMIGAKILLVFTYTQPNARLGNRILKSMSGFLKY
jgi:hypothetical protein